jgi:hypothetical protein
VALPFCPLTEAYNPGLSPSHKPRHLGFSPFLESVAAREREEGKSGRSGGGEGEAKHRVAADAPLLGTARCREEPNRSLLEEEDARVGWERRSRAKSRTPPRTSTPHHCLRQAGDNYTSAPP